MTRPLAARLFFVIATSSVVACAAAPVRIPPAALASPGWNIVGYRAGTVLDPDFQIGDGAVRNVLRKKPPTTMASRTIAKNERSVRTYGFTFHVAGRTLLGSCTDVSEPVGQQVVGFGKFKQVLDCICREGEQVRVELTLVDGAGKLFVGDRADYQVTPIHETETDMVKATLGYQFSSQAGTGALDRTGHARAWPPTGLDSATSQDLGCAYASLLLSRP